MRWDEVRRVYSDAVEGVVNAASAIPAEAWLAPRDEGKWSPAEIVEHLTLACEVLLRELEGGEGMRVRTSWWQRVLLRVTMVPRLLSGKPFPAGARAPRETRPELRSEDQASAIARFRERSGALESAAAEGVMGGRRVYLTHAYFGRAPVEKALLLSARHIEHHLRQLTR
ncbi:MAG TPA: DinB family protein [Thermoanaerobaculia bacterium]